MVTIHCWAIHHCLLRHFFFFFDNTARIIFSISVSDLLMWCAFSSGGIRPNLHLLACFTWDLNSTRAWKSTAKSGIDLLLTVMIISNSRLDLSNNTTAIEQWSSWITLWVWKLYERKIFVACHALSLYYNSELQYVHNANVYKQKYFSFPANLSSKNVLWLPV